MEVISQIITYYSIGRSRNSSNNRNRNYSNNRKKITLTIDHKIIQTTDDTINILLIDPVIVIEIETKTIKTDQETILSHLIEIFHNIQKL